MVRYVVTSKEADVIRAVDDKSGATVTELSGSTHLAPSEVRDALSRLLDRGIIQSADDKDFLFLTNDGRRLHEALGGDAATEVWVLTDDENLAPSEDTENLDAAIEEAISKIR